MTSSCKNSCISYCRWTHLDGCCVDLRSVPGINANDICTCCKASKNVACPTCLTRFRNTGFKLCQRNQVQFDLVKGMNNKIYLLLLKSLVIQYLTSCTEVYEAQSKYLEPLKELRAIVFHRNLINHQSFVFERTKISSRQNFCVKICFGSCSFYPKWRQFD